MTWAAAWAYPLARTEIWWCGAAAAVATVAMGVGVLIGQRAHCSLCLRAMRSAMRARWSGPTPIATVDAGLISRGRGHAGSDGAVLYRPGADGGACHDLGRRSGPTPIATVATAAAAPHHQISVRASG
jgi:hypothetical protein